MFRVLFVQMPAMPRRTAADSTGDKSVTTKVLCIGSIQPIVVWPRRIRYPTPFPPLEHDTAMRSEEAGGLLFSPAEIEQPQHIGAEAGVSFDPATLKTVA